MNAACLRSAFAVILTAAHRDRDVAFFGLDACASKPSVGKSFFNRPQSDVAADDNQRAEDNRSARLV